MAMTKLRDCAATLPITPSDKPGIGLVMTPFLADAIGKKLGIENAISLNVSGMKLKNQNVDQCVLNYLLAIKSLDINTDIIWRDDQKENEAWISGFFNQLKKEGYISREIAQIIKCKCGAVESLAEIENISPSRNICLIDNSKQYCKLCKSEVQKSQESVYLFHFPKSVKFEKVHPLFYAKEIDAMVSKFKGCKFLISKSRPTATSLLIENESIFLNVDFVWQMFLPLLCRYGHNPTILVGGSKNLLACCFSMILYQIIDQKDVYLVIPPYYLSPGRKSLKNENYLCENLTSKYDSKTIRLFLATALNWAKKEAVLDLGLIDLISKMSYRINSAKKLTDLDIALSDFESKKIKDLLAQFRKSRDYFYSEELYGLI